MSSSLKQINWQCFIIAMDIVTKRIKVRGIPDAWKDRIKMQSLYSLEDKGYKKKVYWEKSTIDSSFAGIFAEEYIMKGEIIRVLEKDVTMIVFNGKEDLPPLTETFTLSGETLSGEIFVGRNYSSGEIFVTKLKIRHFRPTKSFAQ